MTEVWDMNVRLWGGPRDGEMIRIPSDSLYWKIPEPIPVSEWLNNPDPMEPTLKVTTYRITRSPYGLVAVHPTVDLKPLSQE